jgi:hypothetical protein
MHLILIGCEYAGKTSLAAEILKWIDVNMGHPICGWHDHFVLPFAEGPEPDATEEAEQILALKPKVLEKYSRYMIEYHLNDSFYKDDHHLLVNWYYADAVYAPLYYGYGGRDQYADRQEMARHYDDAVMRRDPDTVLVHMKASPEVIRRRKAANPHPRDILQDKDIEFVLQRFAEEYLRSGIRRKFELDTTHTASVQETFAEFLAKYETHMRTLDRLRLLSHSQFVR